MRCSRRSSPAAPGSRAAQDKYFLPNRSIADGNQMVIYTGYASIASSLGKIFDPSAFWNPGTNQATETRKVYAKATVQFLPRDGRHRRGRQ